MQLVYTRKSDGGLTHLHGASIEEIARIIAHYSADEFKSLQDAGIIPASVVRDTDAGTVTLTQDEYHAFIIAKDVPADAMNVTIIPNDAVLPDMEFFNSWTHDGKAFGYNLEKAKEIRLERVRRARDLLLTKYDGLQAKANDMNDVASMAKLKVQKQALRDCTNALKNLMPTSIDDIKNATTDLLCGWEFNGSVG